jgi:hypothetical protein
MLSNRSLVLFPAIILSLLTCLTAGASALQCRQALRSDVQTVKIEGRRFTFMAWNLKNVFTYQGKFEREDGMNNMRRAEGPEGAIRPKPMHEVRAVRDMLARKMPDFAVFTEIENVFSLRRLLEEDPRLQGQYHVFLKEGNDPRGIDIAFIVKKELGFNYKLDTHKDMTWTDRYKKEGKTIEETGPLFSRDLPVLKVYQPGSDQPAMIIMGNHAKSQRDREGDPNSTRWRMRQYEAIAEILESYKAVSPNAAIILAGDMNTDVRTSNEIKPIKTLIPSIYDIIDPAKKIPMKDRVTHSFFPWKGNPKYSQLDDIRALGLRELFEAQILPFLDSKGQPLPRPKNFKERESQQPSDHSPLWMEFAL